MTNERLRDKFRGALIGTFVGDAVGVPVEGFPHDQLSDILDGVSRMPKDSPTRAEVQAQLGLICNPDTFPDDSAEYSDDTQMMHGLAESLVAHGAFDGADIAERFKNNFQVWRGYGAGAYGLILELKKGEPWNEVGGRLFNGEGSFGNGGAMRVAPVGVWGHRNPALLQSLATQQAHITHTHPIGAGGAAFQAAAVAVACRTEPSEWFDGEAFVGEVEQFLPSVPDAYHYALKDIREFLENIPPTWDAQERLGSSIEAHESVPAALYAFLRNPYSFESAVSWAVRLGDDTDTVGAMAGAIAGAFHGYSAIPEKWLRALENSEKGRDYTLALADQLFDRWLTDGHEQEAGTGTVK